MALTRKAPAPVLLLCALVLLVQFATASGTIFGTDGAKRFAVAEGLMTHGRADIQTIDRVPIGIDGKQYAQYAIGHSLAMVPFSLAGRLAGVFVPEREQDVVEFAASLTNLVATMLVVGWLAVFARDLGFSTRTAVVLGLLYAFGTIAWQQSKDSFEHPLVALYFTILFYYLHRFAETRRRKLLLFAGCALGLALLTRYTTVLGYGAVAVFLSVLAARSRSPHRLRDFIGWAAIVVAATLPFVGFDLWFNYVRFGSPFETGHVQLHGNLLSPASFLNGLFGLTLHWEHGLFAFNPALIVGLWGIGRFYRRHQALAIAFLTAVGLHLAFYAATPEFLWVGGWNWGPRFFVDVMPMMVLMCGPVFEADPGTRRPGRVAKWSVAVLVAASVLIQCESVLVNSNRDFAKKAGGVDGYSYQRHGIRDTLVYMQAESVWQVSRNLWTGRGPSTGAQPDYRSTDAPTLINDSLTYGTFQIWWVYALHLRIARGLILAYLAGTIIALAWLAGALRRALAADSRRPPMPSRDCPCTSPSSIRT